MTRTRRSALLLVLTVAVVVGASLPANALFSDSAALAVQPTVGTTTVTAPGNVRVETECVTTTTTSTRVYRMSDDTSVSSSETTATDRASSNVESNATTRADNTPVPGEYTLTQTIQDTQLHATATWDRSSTPGVVGYTLMAFLADDTRVPIGTAAPSATQYSDSYDASVLQDRPRLSMVTLTGYGWTAPGATSGIITC